MRPKARELRMMSVSFRHALEHCTREQALSPQRNHTFGVKVLGVERPQSHWGT